MKNRSFSVIIVFVALAMLGCALIPGLTVKLVPSEELPGLSVSFTMAGATPRVVESEVTARLESMLARIRGVRRVCSRSSAGSGYISLTFDRHTDMQHARFETAAVVRQAWPQLPQGVSYPTVSPAMTLRGASRPVLTYTINAPVPASSIMEYAERTVRPVIGRLHGISRVTLSGAEPMEWRLTYDSRQLYGLGLTPYDIASAISSASGELHLGMAVTDSGEWLVLSCQPGDEMRAPDLTAIYVTTTDSIPVSLDRLVTARLTEAVPTGYYRINGLTSVYCNVYASDEANQPKIAAEVRAAMGSMELPPGWSLQLRSDSTERITTELDKIYLRSGLTLAILLTFLALVTMNLRYMTVITVALMLSLGVSVIFYRLAGVELQLYSLAGITISLNLIIDNLIVMSDHYRRRRDMRAFTSVLAATLTTVAALSAVYFLNDRLRLNLQDFVVVVMINLGVSLAVALLLVPALIDLIVPRDTHPRHSYINLRRIAQFNRCYASFIKFGQRHRRILIITTVIAFGLPVYLIPSRVDGWDLYNSTVGSEMFCEKIRPWIDKTLGGTLRLFARDVYGRTDFTRPDREPRLNISVTQPNGATLEQMNSLVKLMEHFLAGQTGISQFTTNIYSFRNAEITVEFKREVLRTDFPFDLKNEAVRMALTFGGGSWSVSGLEESGFTNRIEENGGSLAVRMTGYNYDELERLAEEFRRILLTHPRIREVTIAPEYSMVKNDYTEYFLDIDREALARKGLTVASLYAAITPAFGRDISCGTTPGGREQIRLTSMQADTYDVWAMMNMPFTSGGRTFRLSEVANISRMSAPQSVVKEDQQYVLCLQYDYKGPILEGSQLLNDDLVEFGSRLPLGYSAEREWNRGSITAPEDTDYLLILFIVAVIFVISAILFDSLILPMVIIFTIPVSFIGVFVTFWLTGLGFDQGGFAALVLLSGITVNAAIYLLSEYRHTGNYLRAFDAKIIPILLTMLSTVLGFIPFMIGGDGREVFWYPFAAGTVGGLAMSLVAVVVLLPLLLRSPLKKIRTHSCRLAK